MQREDLMVAAATAAATVGFVRLFDCIRIAAISGPASGLSSNLEGPNSIMDRTSKPPTQTEGEAFLVEASPVVEDILDWRVKAQAFSR